MPDVTARILPEPPRDARFDPACRRCPRLAAFLDEVREAHPTYWCRPVPPFGDTAARLLVVGLAPGMHGANASGRPFTGDHAGILLYRTLHAYGFASRPDGARADDGLTLVDCRVNNAVKCLPPGNKPQPAEIAGCNAFLAADLATLPPRAAVLALGRIAHEAVLRALGRRQAEHPFAHAAQHRLSGTPRRHDALRQLPLQSLQHQHAAPDAGDVRGGVRRHRGAPARRERSRSVNATRLEAA